MGKAIGFCGVLLDHNKEYSYYSKKASTQSGIALRDQSGVETENSQSGNRLFIIIAVALIGLICIGLLGLGGVLFLTASNRAQEDITLQITATPTPFPPTFTPTPTPTFTPTDTPVPTPTGTPVVPIGGQAAQPTATPEGGEGQAAISATTELNVTATNTPVVGTPTESAAGVSTGTPAVVPGSGGVLPVTSNSILLWLGGGLLAVLILSGTLHRIFNINVKK